MPDAFLVNKKIGRGINIGNSLEAPMEGEWEIIVKPEYFKIIKDAGFNSVRIPIRWSAHTLNFEPYTIEKNFFNRVDFVIQQALENNLLAIINIHHFTELYSKPKKNEEKYYSLWKQISGRYSNYSENLLFEILNEPQYKLTSRKWNKFIPNVVEIIRDKCPKKTILIGPAKWNNIEGISQLKLPKNIQNIIVTFHYYKPFIFTHQGAEWVWFSNLFLGRKWKASYFKKNKIDLHFQKVCDWGIKNNVPINLGEFGVYHKADFNSRILWTTEVVKAAKKYNFSLIYWEFGAGFGVYDIKKNIWRQDLLNALLQ